jgi:hypothetical protein
MTALRLYHVRWGCRPSIHLTIALLATAAIWVPSAIVVEAAPSYFWISRETADYAEAEFDGVVLRADGTLVSGYESRTIELAGADVAWAVLTDDGGAVAGTGHGGLLYRVVRGRASALDSTGSGQILSLARGGDGAIYAGTGPDGRVLRVTEGKTETYFETGASYVWGLAWSGGSLFAATGPEGHLFQITGSGAGRAVFRSPDGQLTSVTGDDRGGVFVGSAGKGIVYWHSGGRTRALFEAPETEIRSLAYDDSVLFAAALAISPVQIEGAGDNKQARVTPAPRNKTTPRSTVYRIVPDASVTAWWSPPEGLIFALATDPEAGLLVATGQRAGLYAVDERGRGHTLYQTDQGDVTGLSVDGNGDVWWSMSNPTRLLHFERSRSGGTVRSKVLDAEIFSRWGRFTSVVGGRGGVEFATRSGNTEKPDTTWSDWRGLSSGETVASPPGRFLQWRARIAPGAEVKEVSIALVDVNQAPRIEELLVEPLPGGFYQGELTPRQEPVTQLLSGGQRVQFSITRPPPGELEVLPDWARGIRPISWKASDPNEDPLLYRLEYRREGSESWVLLADDLEVLNFVWDTSALPEGGYTVRLTASDRLARGEQALSDERSSAGVTVDLTSPTLRVDPPRIEARAALLTGVATDAGLYVRLVEVSGDGQSWLPATPDDGIWDGPRERFTVRLPDLATGVHALRLRAVDAVGNSLTQTLEVSVSP